MLDWIFSSDLPIDGELPQEHLERQRLLHSPLVTTGHTTTLSGVVGRSLQTPPLSAAVRPIPPSLPLNRTHTHLHTPWNTGTLIPTVLELTWNS